MELKFDRKPKCHAVGIRLTNEEIEAVKKIAKQNGASLAETCVVLLRATLIKVEKEK